MSHFPFCMLLMEYGTFEYHLLALQGPVGPIPVDAPSILGTGIGSVDATVQMQIIIFLTTVVTLAYNIWSTRSKDRRDARQRKWDLEDRQSAREDAERARAALSDQITTASQKADEVSQQVQERTQVLEKKLEENTQLSANAFNAANSFNSKLADVLKKFESGDALVEFKETVLTAVPRDDRPDSKSK